MLRGRLEEGEEEEEGWDAILGNTEYFRVGCSDGNSDGRLLEVK